MKKTSVYLTDGLKEALGVATRRAGRSEADLIRFGLEDAVSGERLGLPGERHGPLHRLANLPGSYLATAIVPPRERKGHR